LTVGVGFEETGGSFFEHPEEEVLIDVRVELTSVSMTHNKCYSKSDAVTGNK
jgi:hypothetical protein